MSKEIIQIKVFVSCPNDVEAEKEIVKEICNDISEVLSETRNIQVKSIDWRNDVVPLITGEGPQAEINKQIEEYDFDIYIGIMWKRFGDKQSNGLTPTEEEFENAFQRYKESERPFVQFYFKLDEFYPRGIDEAQQTVEIQKFKERIKNLGLYGEFKGKEEFRRKINKSIWSFVEKFSTSTYGKIPIPKMSYPEVSPYLQRKVCPARGYSSKFSSFLGSELTQDIIAVIRQHNRIVLIGDAGVGKTKELQRVAWYFSKSDSFFYPIFVSLNKYVNQNLSELFPSNWSTIPDDQLLIILDGLDEIESKNKSGAIRHIELFSEQHPNSHIIVSCRTNFYKLETEQSSGTLSGFYSYILLDLDEKEIKNYIDTRLGEHAEAFNEIIF